VKHESALVQLNGRWTFPSPSDDQTVEIRIFPNPSDGKVYVQFSQDIPAGTVISVVNSLGQEVLKRKLDSNPGTIDLSGNASGVYYVRIKADSVIRTEKVVLK
jgi:hypothetical protein